MSTLLDALKIDRCAVVGLSVGGMWGAELALREPERVSALIMLDTDLGAEPEATRQRYFQMLDAIAALGAIPAPSAAMRSCRSISDRARTSPAKWPCRSVTRWRECPQRN